MMKQASTYFPLIGGPTIAKGIPYTDPKQMRSIFRAQKRTQGRMSGASERS